MNSHFFKAILIGSIIHVVAVPVRGETAWSRVSPPGAGFSVEAPGTAQPDADSGQYTYSSGFWSLSVKLLAVHPGTRALVERRDRKALVRCLESMRDTMAGAVTAEWSGSSSGDIDGYPSLRFSIKTAEIEGEDLLVLTGEHLYLVMTVGPRGTRKDDAKRFLRSFRLLATDGLPVSDSRAADAASTNPVATTLAGPMFTATRLIIEERTNRRIEGLLQAAPPAARLGTRWNPSTQAWQDAPTSITGRIAQLVDAYGKSGNVVRALESELEQLTPESRAALAASLHGPAGPAIVRQLARSQFVLMMMTDDPDGPRAGEPAWREKLKALQTLFDQRIGSALPSADGSDRTAVDAFFSDSSADALRLCSVVIGRATRELEDAINLMMFDNGDAIGREIETVIAGVK
ncbi:hypothetical protein LuPra_02414 [Luteitalea pratensis]|uniref:Uncharacterized protein n=1 Tax=Luteitalea pratensis TaxID=1855912 RepID=A0A143PL29_LUTPR|nr:hypothetical protein [Luteitalea pratensis]AMY09201.1 hypothetical protein LuPra_02414 [Luteitalea pratensis]